MRSRSGDDEMGATGGDARLRYRAKMLLRLATCCVVAAVLGSCDNPPLDDGPEAGPMVCFACGSDDSGLAEVLGDGAMDAAMSRDAADAAAPLDAGEDSDGGASDAGDACCAPACGTRLTHGPLLGAVSERSVKVWARADSEAELGVVYWPADDPASASFVIGDALGADSDYTGTAELTDLEPETEYEYRLLLVGDTCAPEPLPSQRFHTLPPPEPPAPLRFGFGADIYRTDAPVFDRVAEHGPAFMLLIGDNIYADEVMPTLEGYRAKYREIWGGTQLRAFMAHVPVFMMWDDHEIINDFWPGKSERFDVAVVAYGEYQHSHNPAPVREGVRYYSFRAGGVGFFVLDTRSYRSENDAPDGPSKSMLGDRQKQDLFDWLSSSPDPVKLVVSSVPFSDHGTTANDSWRGFPTERAEIFRFIWDQGITGVLLMSGDQHWSGLFRLEGATADEVLYEVMPTPIAIHNRAAPTYESPQILARDDDHEVYALFDVDPTVTPLRIHYTLCDANAPCEPGNEPPPGSPLDLPPEADNVPYGLELELQDGRFELVEGGAPTDADAGT